MSTEKLYYIQNKAAGYIGNAIVFWAQDRRGYTSNLDKAHQFTAEEAKVICLGNPEKNKAWPVTLIDTNEGTYRVVDSQYLDSDNIVEWKKEAKDGVS
jgi:hypothetical protein